MKLRVCKEFIDKTTGKHCKPGTIINVTKKRASEIMAYPQTLVEVVEEPQKSAKRGDTK